MNVNPLVEVRAGVPLAFAGSDPATHAAAQHWEQIAAVAFGQVFSEEPPPWVVQQLGRP